MSSEESKLHIDEEGAEDSEASHVAVERGRHTIQLMVLNQINDLKLPGEAAGIEGYASDDRVGACEGGGCDDHVPEDHEGEASEDAAHKDEEDPEDDLAVSVDLVDESVVKNETKCYTTPGSSNCGADLREVGEGKADKDGQEGADAHDDPSSRGR